MSFKFHHLYHTRTFYVTACLFVVFLDVCNLIPLRYVVCSDRLRQQEYGTRFVRTTKGGTGKWATTKEQSFMLFQLLFSEPIHLGRLMGFCIQ